MGVKHLLAGAACCAVAVFPAAASAASWLPHPEDATWTYQWSDSIYSGATTNETYTVKEQKGRSFTLAWTTAEQGNSPEAVASAGTVSYQETQSGLVNTDWASTPPPAEFPILCPQAGSCNNSLAGTHYLLIWGSRGPVLAEPLLAGTSWNATGGAGNDVASASRYLGTEKVSVPAFPEPVAAAKVVADVAQVGAIGDPYGSGVRTVWWVYGVGPVKIRFDHAGGANAATTVSVLTKTSLTPLPPPPDANYFPLVEGDKLTYRWTNSKHLRRPSVQRFTVDQVANGSARFSVEHVRGPIRVAGAYAFTSRSDGVTTIGGSTQAASRAGFPRLGPRGASRKERNHFFTPFDLMAFGLNPIVTAYPEKGDRWRSRKGSHSYRIFGVHGHTKVMGERTIKVPAGRFRTVKLRSKLWQPGFRFGSGRRDMWFAPGKGLVKLVFKHKDGSTSRVVLVR